MIIMSDKTKTFYKTVLMPIEVPYGDYCWGDGRICEHLDNYGGCPSCDFNFCSLKFDTKGRIPKPPECRALQEQSGYKDDYEEYNVVYHISEEESQNGNTCY